MQVHFRLATDNRLILTLLDFSKAFDSVNHSLLLAKGLPMNVYHSSGGLIQLIGVSDSGLSSRTSL